MQSSSFLSTAQLICPPQSSELGHLLNVHLSQSTLYLTERAVICGFCEHLFSRRWTKTRPTLDKKNQTMTLFFLLNSTFSFPLLHLVHAFFLIKALFFIHYKLWFLSSTWALFSFGQGLYHSTVIFISCTTTSPHTTLTVIVNLAWSANVPTYWFLLFIIPCLISMPWNYHFHFLWCLIIDLFLYECLSSLHLKWFLWQFVHSLCF